MQTRTIGALKVSIVGLGCNNFGGRLDQAATAAVVHAALDAGIDFFDTADKYGNELSEVYLGKALHGQRDRVVIATKFGVSLDEHRKGARPEYVKRAVDASLRRLGTDYIDLYQLHIPDPATPIGDTLAALDELVRAGKVREIGCSNFSSAQLREAEAAASGARFISVQNEYSLLVRTPEAEVLPEVTRQGMAFLPYFPLASGLLTGKYRSGAPEPAGARLSGTAAQDPRLETVEALRAFAAERGHSLLELAFSWLLSKPQVASVIAGATRQDQVRANAVAANWELSAAELRAVDAILSPRA